MTTILTTTADGSNTLFVPEIDECYHSTNGAIQESEYIFIEHALRYHSQTNVEVLEIGFGTGLNDFLTLLEAERTGRKVHLTTIELYPIPEQTADLLNFAKIIAPKNIDDFKKLHACAWGEEVTITPHFSLTKIQTDFTKYHFGQTYDVIYFDAFSPEKQPEMWSEEIFEKLYLATSPEGVLTTYCAKGAVRRAMQKAGYTVERLPGPIGKREILRATKK
ncbi:MAG: SAM-dependent methyltransferase [Bacteroidales bacterium]|nr:SAM-dependent methyltransferase [Bacteroidales bacterium]